MLAKGLFRVGSGLRLVMPFLAVSLSVVMFTLVEPPESAAEPGAAVFGCLVLLVGTPAAVVVHECGHLVACLAFRVKVREFRIGRPDRGAYRFAVGGMTVAMGKPFAGQVVHDPVPSRWRAAVVVMAGSLANLVAAGVLLALGLATAPPLSGAVQVPVHQAIEVSVAALFAATGISGLLPSRTRWGSLSDGARLLTLGSGRLARALQQDAMLLRGPKGAIWRPANAAEAAEYRLDSAVLKQLADDPGAQVPPELVDKWLTAWRDRTFIGLVAAGAVGRALRKDGRVAELLHLLEEYPAPHGKLAPAMWHSMSCLAYEVALLPGMPPHVVNMAVDRLQQVMDAYDSVAAPNVHLVRAAVLHSMAVARLRQGNFAVVEQLCQEALASREVSARDRATVLATVALARRALGQPYETLLAEATRLDPEADLVAEAAARPAAVDT